MCHLMWCPNVVYLRAWWKLGLLWNGAFLPFFSFRRCNYTKLSGESSGACTICSICPTDLSGDGFNYQPLWGLQNAVGLEWPDPMTRRIRRAKPVTSCDIMSLWKTEGLKCFSDAHWNKTETTLKSDSVEHSVKDLLLSNCTCEQCKTCWKSNVPRSPIHLMWTV